MMGSNTDVNKRLDGHDVQLAIHSTYFKLIGAGLTILVPGVMYLVFRALGG